MTISTLPKRTRRLLALAITLLVVALGAGAVLGPMEWLRRQAIAQKTLVSHTQDLRAQLVNREQLIRERERLEAARAQRTDLFEAATPVLAGAAMQGTLADLVQSSGGVLESTALEPPSPEQSLTKITTRVELLNDIDGLRELLHAIETHHPALVIETISLRRRGEEFALDLDISMRIVGFTTAPLPSAAATRSTNRS